MDPQDRTSQDAAGQAIDREGVVGCRPDIESLYRVRGVDRYCESRFLSISLDSMYRITDTPPITNERRGAKGDEMRHLIRDKASDCYAVEHTGDDRAEIADLFGTATLPTPFRLCMDAGEVMRRLADRNPGLIDSTDR